MNLDLITVCFSGAILGALFYNTRQINKMNGIMSVLKGRCPFLKKDRK